MEDALPKKGMSTTALADPSLSEDKSDTESSEERDEVEEVRKVAGRDTFHVLVWRIIATGVLLATAVAVTLTTYYFLQRQQTDSFETQFEQFSRTVADAALDQQKRAILAHRGFADSISTYVEHSDHDRWPNVQVPRFETQARNVIKQSSTEILTLNPILARGGRDDYIAFVNSTYEAMIEEAHIERQGNLDRLNPINYKGYIFRSSPNGYIPDDVDREYDFPILNFSPAPSTYGFINVNGASNSVYGPLVDNMLEMKTETLITEVKGYSSAVGVSVTAEEHAAMHENVFLENSVSGNPHAFLFIPVFRTAAEPESGIVASMSASFAWDVFMIGLLPKGVNGIEVILENSCGQVYTYEINGPTVTFRGEGDKHETKYNDLETYQYLSEGMHSHPLYEVLDNHCRYNLRIYPSTKFEESLDPHVPKVFAIVVACTFLLVALVFFIYDLFVYKRNEKLIANNAQSNAIVSSLFPSNIRDKLINPTEEPNKQRSHGSSLKNFMIGADGSPTSNDNKPLADLFLECTVLFADIAGFTAWSSVREPSQVFTILETVYGAFDHIAKVRRVFKVETVGDCYVAATGIPEYRKDHSMVMVRFARDILAKMSVLTKELETTLGPDTGDLSLRIGIHTGPVTAGVLRGERARFQLFGDTMNVCSRIEGTGVAGRIHISGETAECLRKNGKGHWVIKREETVHARGKGEIQTYWIGVGVERDRREGSVAGSSSGDPIERENINAVFEPTDHGKTEAAQDARMTRLVDWNVEMLSQILIQIVASREAKSHDSQRQKTWRLNLSMDGNDDFVPLDNVQEIIRLPDFDAKAARHQADPNSIVLPQDVMNQLRSYVTSIAGMYKENAFHNFEHASHVTMSVIKLLSRIVAPSELLDDGRSREFNGANFEATLHDHTYGITSDPLTQFSCAFAAMIHDVDHQGVPNTQLVKEGTRLAKVYNARSVAEQNSLVIAWELLLSHEYNELRSALCADQAELDRFRQLVVNTVMATDIVDKDLKALRNGRWDRAFKDLEEIEDECTARNRKATIVIEHLIQASDVAHTMQHWHVYRKWNEKFFQECYEAYLSGRAEKDPTDAWYKGEIGFFDFYIIPLAKKLKECGVFGKSSDEYLTYALANRGEWEKRGEEVVAEMVQALRSKKAQE